MKKANIKFILIQIDEAHSTGWPIGLVDTPEPQKSFQERIERANKFVLIDKPADPFTVLIDGWSNEFAETFHAWPDKYYMVDPQYQVLAKAEYGTEGSNDALIKVDCSNIICSLIQ